MNKWLQSTIGISFAGLIVLLANSGKGFIDSLWAAFLFLQKISDHAVLGIGSFILACLMAVLFQAFIHRYTKELPCPRSGDFCLGLVSLFIGTSVMWIQLHTLNGLLLGILAGFASPFLYQGLSTLWNLALKKEQ